MLEDFKAQYPYREMLFRRDGTERPVYRAKASLIHLGNLPNVDDIQIQIPTGFEWVPVKDHIRSLAARIVR